MTLLCISTSSPISSVALLRGDFVLGAKEREAPRAASGACIAMIDELLTESQVTFEDIDLFVADCGPGSFTGVKVAIAMVKAYAWSLGKRAAQISSFDLISRSQPAAAAIRKGRYIVRPLDGIPFEASEAEIVSLDCLRSVKAANILNCLDLLQPTDPVSLEPIYFAEPSISVAKNPRIMGTQGSA